MANDHQHQLSLFEHAKAELPRLSDEQVVTRLCEELLEQAEARPPIPVEMIASLRGIVAIEEAPQPWAGMIVRRGNNFAVTLRSGDGNRRQRFTICHEAGHTLFPGFADGVEHRCNGQRTRTEVLCDVAASELLLPRRDFVPDLLNSTFDLNGVEDLAGEYEASLEATALRTVNLWPEPAMLLVFSQRHKPSEEGREHLCAPKLRVDYAYTQGSWPFVPRHKSVDDDSPIADALRGHAVDIVGTLGSVSANLTQPVEIHARSYGKDRRVLALIRAAR
jgi:hypothetical protein